MVVGADRLGSRTGGSALADVADVVVDMKVFSWPDESGAASAAIRVESSPPLRNTPSGTSEIIRLATDCSSSSAVSSTRSPS